MLCWIHYTLVYYNKQMKFSFEITKSLNTQNSFYREKMCTRNGIMFFRINSKKASVRTLFLK